MTDTQALIADWLVEFPSKTTRSTYRLAVTQFAASLDGDVLEATRADVRHWIASLTNSDLKDSTVRVKASAVSSFYSHLRIEGLIEFNPAEDVKRPQGESEPRLGLTLDDARRLIAEAEAHSKMASALVWLMSGAGLRVEEACSARIEDLSGDLLTVRVKGRHRQIKALSEEVLVAVLAVIGDRTTGAVVIDGDGREVKPWKAQRLIAELGARAGIVERVHPHLLRHTAATLAIEQAGEVCDACGRAGIPIEDVSALLGHRQIETTLKYVRGRDVMGGTRAAAASLGKVLRGAT